MMPAPLRASRAGRVARLTVAGVLAAALPIVAAGLLALSPALARQKDRPKDDDAEASTSKLHTPDQILKIMEKSSLTYEIGLDNNLPLPTLDTPRVLSNEILLKENDGDLELTDQSLSKEAAAILEAGEQAFKKQDLDTALERYTALFEIAPAYVHALTLFGDLFYARGDYDKARESFEKAIDRNFADYEAHWFLSDALWRLDDKSQAIREITIAHLLNVNHQQLKKALLQCRDKIGRPWKDWDYAPRFALSRDGRKVKISAQEEWIGYAIVKAVWAYEPGYSESVAGADYQKHVITMEEEKEALLALLNGPKAPQQIARIVEDGYVNEFLTYEILARRAPAALVLLPREYFMRVVQYVDTYH